MYKVINLDIDGTLTGDTRVEEIALVEMPAVEQNFIYFGFEKSFVVPQNVSRNACRARKFKDENGSSCGTPVGWTRSSQLCDRKPITLDTVKRMASFFARHSVNEKPGLSYEEGCHAIMWDAWGGDAGKDWAERILKRQEEMGYDTSNLPQYDNYPTGDTENDMLVEPIDFIEKVPDETKKEYINRCVEWHIKNKGWDSDQSYAVCVSQADEAFALGEKVSFDYDDTLTTPRGMGLARHELNSGSEVYIISARGNKEPLLRVAEELGIPSSRVFAVGSNRQKINKIKELNIIRHYDNNDDVIKELGNVGQDFMCDCLDEFIKEQFYNIDGCDCRAHFDEQGNEVYVPCDIQTEQEFGTDEYTDEEIEVVKLLKFLKDTDYEKFEAVVGAMRGATENELKRRNHRNPTIYFKYERVLTGAPDRDFCMSIENRYFRRLEIDLLRDVNREFGHEKQPYSKWLYKGGPNCVHAWKKFLVQGDVISDQGFAEGRAGTPPKSMPNNGYYSPETKRKSEIAYIISQQNMNKQMFGDDEKRMLYGPLMIPNILIPRLDDNGDKYFVKFTPESIEKTQQLYMMEKRLDKTNYEHTNNKIPSVVLVESWIVSGEKDKAYQLGFNRDNIPDGTWMGGFKVLDTPEGDYIWNDFIKTGKVKGFSVEGEFLMKFSRQKTDEYLLEEIINILKQINN